MGSERVVLEVFSQEKTGEICRSASLAESVIPGRVLGWVSTDGADYGQVTFLNSQCCAKDTEIERLKAENQRYERLFTSREQDHKELCERYDQLEAENATLKVEHAHECAKVSQRDREIEELKAQLSASEARVTILCVNDTNEPVALSYAAQAWGNHQIPAGKALAIVEVKP